MAYACPAGDSPEGEVSRALFLKQGKPGIYECFFQVSVVIWLPSFSHGKKIRENLDNVKMASYIDSIFTV